MTHRDTDAVAEVVAAHLPGYRVGSVVPLGEGLDNVAYEVNGELIVRFGRAPDPVRVDREARLLAMVATITTLPVPAPVFTAPDEGCLAYPKLPGVSLLDLPAGLRADHGVPVAAELGGFLAALHAVPVARVAGLVDADDPPLEEWRQAAVASYAAAADAVPPAHRVPVEAFLDGPPPAGAHATVFSHNDLGIEHVLVDPDRWTVTGVIDWSDAAIVDPAFDLGLLYRDLGPAALRAALDRYRPGAGDLAALRERALFYARCALLEDLVYGIDSGRTGYLVKSLDGLEWLFPG